MTEWISRSEAGRRLGVTHTAVAKYIKKGLPSREDKKVEWPSTKEWLGKHNHPEASRNFHTRKAAKAKLQLIVAEACHRLPADAKAADLLADLHGIGIVRVVEVAAALGLSRAQQRAALYIATSWLWSVAGIELSEGCGPNGPSVDYSGLGDVPLTPKQESESDRLISIAEAVLGLSEQIEKRKGEA